MSIKDIFTNTVKVDIVCADMERFISSLVSQSIDISNMHYIDDITASINIPAKYLEYIKKASAQYGAQIKHQGTSLLNRSIHAVLTRPVLILGVLLMIALSVYISRTILFVQVSGNDKVSTVQILDQAEASGLYFGISKSDIRSELIKNALLENIPQLQWAGVNTSGCVATISVKERSDQKKSEAYEGPSSIVAAKDGVVQSVTVVKGAVSCKIGQAVSEGDILISAYNDYGNVTVISGAEGEVYANTINEIQAVSLRNSLVRIEKSPPKVRLSIIFGKNLINLYKDSGILDTSCVKMYLENNVRLPGGFRLPIRLCFEQIQESQTEPFLNDQALWLADSGKAYLQDRMISGKILEQQLTETMNEQLLICRLRLSCCEMIGKTKQEEIFIFNGKDNRTDR